MVSLHEFREIIRQKIAKITLLDYLVMGIAISYSIGFSLLSIYRYNNFMSYTDLGTSVQALHTTVSRGGLLYTNFEAYNTMVREGCAYFGSYLGVHFTPILLLMAPVFALWPTAETLLVIKSIGIGLSVIPAYYLAKDFLSAKNAFLATLLYVLYPGLHTLTLADFQVLAFFPLLMLLAIYFLRRRNYLLYYPLLVLSLMTSEFMSVLIASYMIIELITSKNMDKHSRVHLIITLLIAGVWFVIANSIMSMFKPQQLSSWNTVIRGGVIQALNYGLLEKMAFLLMMFLPFGFLSLQSPYILSLIPFIGATLTASSFGSFQFGWHYAGYFMPFLYIAMLDAVSKSRKKIHLEKTGDFGKKFIAACFIVSIALSPLNPLTIGNLTGIAYTPKPFDDEHSRFIHDTIELIPPEATVLAQTPISQHLAARSNTYIYVPDVDVYNIEYIVADFTHIDFKFFGFDATIRSALNSFKFGILAYADGILLLKRGYQGQPVLYEKLTQVFGYSGVLESKLPGISSKLVLGDSRVIYDLSSKSKNVIMCEGANRQVDIAWYGPNMWLLPGVYNITFALKVDSSTAIQLSDRLLTLDVTYGAGSHTLAEKRIHGLDAHETGKWFNITLFFALDKIVHDIQFRGLEVNGVNVYLDYISLRQTASAYKPTTFLTFGYEDLYVSNGELVDNVIVHRKGAGPMWFGPQVSLPPDHYTVGFWLRLEDAYDGHMIDLNSTINSTEELAYASIHGEDFTKIGFWQLFELKFVLTSTTNNVNFMGINVEDDAPISLFLIEIRDESP